MSLDLAAKSRIGTAAWAILKLSSFVAGAITFDGDFVRNPIFLVLYIGGTLALLWGCAAQAQLKNYPRALAFIALAGLVGLMALAVIPPRPTTSNPAAC